MPTGFAAALPNGFIQIAGIVLIFAIMYLLMIRPQRKREKQINEMRSALKAGDQITTIGGIKGKIVTTRDDSLIIAVGSDKVKIEVMRWAISKIDAEGPATKKSTAEKKEDAAPEEEEEKPARKPRKLGSSSSVKDNEADDDADTEADADKE